MTLKHNVLDCIKKGLLRKVPASKEKAKESIGAAKKWVEEAEKNLKSKAYQSSVLSSYLGIFHAARAILFRDGLREKSHFCIARYLEEYYAKKDILEMKWIELLDHYRELRHNSQYTTDFSTSATEAENALNKAKEFRKRMESLLNEEEERRPATVKEVKSTTENSEDKEWQAEQQEK